MNDKNHLYSKDDYQKDLKTINKIRASQGFSRFSTSAATSLNDAGLTQAPEAMQIATRDGHFRPINDTFGSFGAVTIDVFVGTKPSGGRSAVTYNIYELTDDTTFTFSGTPSGKMLPVTLDFTINKTAPEPVITWNASVINPPNLIGLLTNGARIILHFETVNDGTNERQIFIGGNSNFGGGGGSQTPWLSDIDADGFNLNDFQNLSWRDGHTLFSTATDLILNAVVGATLIFSVDGTPQLEITPTTIDVKDNTMTNVGNVFFAETGQQIFTSGTELLYQVPVGDVHIFAIDGLPELQITPTSIDVKDNTIINVRDILINSDHTHTIDFTRITAQLDDYTIGTINFRHEDATPVFQNYATIAGVMETDVAANEEGSLRFFVTIGGAHDQKLMAINDAGVGWIDMHVDLNMQTNDVFGADRYILSTSIAATSVLDKGMYSLNANGGVGINSPVDGLGSKFSVLEEEVEKFTVDHVGDSVLVIDYTFNVNDSGAGNNYSINHISANTLISSPTKITYNIGAANQYEHTDGLITFIGAKGVIANIDQLGFRTLGNIIQDTATTMLYSVVPGGEHIFGDGTLVFMDLDTSRAIFDDFYFDFLSRTSPGVTGAANRGRLFMNSANSHHLSIIRNGSIIDLETGSGSQTPWTSDIDAATFDLRNLSNLEFRNPSTGVPAGTIHAIYVDATNDLSYNAIASNFHNFRVNSVSQMTISASVIDFQGNSVIDGIVNSTITGVSGITGLGTQGQNLAMGNNNITGVNQIAFNVANQTITDDVNGMRFSLPDALDTYQFTINTEVALSLEKFFANWGDTAQQHATRTAPASPIAGEVYVYAKAGLGGFSSLWQKQSDGTETDLAAGGSGSQTPWTSNIDADNFSLQDLGIIEFRATGKTLPAATVTYIGNDGTDLVLNVRDNGTSESIDFMTVGALRFTVSSGLVSSIALTANSLDTTGGLDMNATDILDCDNIEFTLTAGGGTASIPYIESDGVDMNFNVPTGDGFFYSVNNLERMKIGYESSVAFLRLRTTVANLAPEIRLWNDGPITDGDALGFINFNGDDDIGNFRNWAYIRGSAADVSSGSKDGRVEIWVNSNNTGSGAANSRGLIIEGGDTTSTPKIGFRTAAAQTIVNVTGSRGGNAALASLLTALAAMGLITDGTSA